MIDLTIIIPTLSNSGDYEQDKKIAYSLRECLISLQETVPEIPLIVASNGGDIKPLPMEATEQVKRIHIWEQGQCKAVNAAVATTNTKWIMISNDDMIYPPGWLEKLVEGLQKGRWIISPKLVEPIDGAPTFIKYSCGGAGEDFDKQKFLNFVNNYDGVSSLGVFCHPGFNLPFLIKRELWDLIGGYDINYDPWGSNGDSDLEYKIKLAEHQPIQNDMCIVYHFSQTSGTFHPRNQKHWNRNFAYFEEKWGFPRTDEGIWEASFEIPYEKLKFRPSWAKII